MARWNLDSIPWHEFDPRRVNPDLVVLAKTASVIEYNSADYVQYLCNVFAGDEEMCAAARVWGEEEKQHGEALARWAKLADPSFDFRKSLTRFRESFHVPAESAVSIRGSRSAELVARCVVECGTTTYYSCLADVTDEPVFRALCRQIALDEIQHYNLFHRTLQKYLAHEPLSKWRRLRVALSRISEVGDEEIMYAFAATNLDGEIRSDHLQDYLRSYLSRAFAIYSERNLRKGIVMAWRAAGFDSSSLVPRVLSRVFHRLIQWKSRRMRTAVQPWKESAA